MPDDVRVGELIPELVAALSLPISSPDGTPVNYDLHSKSLGRVLAPDETLKGAKIEPGDIIALTPRIVAGGGQQRRRRRGRVSVSMSPVGLPLDDLQQIDIDKLKENEPALMMTLHAYKSALSQMDDYREEALKARQETERLVDQVKEKNLATVLLILGQIQIAFGISLVTNDITGGWFVFGAGLALNIGALYVSFFGWRWPSRF